MERRQSYKGFLILCIAILSFASPALAQNKVNATVVMTKARHEYLKNNFWGALEEYRKIYDKNTNDPKLIFRMGGVSSFT